MAKKVLRPLSFIVAIVAIVVIFFLTRFRSSAKYATVEIGNASVKAEIADTVDKQMKGLMSRDDLKENEGMLFIFNDYDYHAIWMMNMKFPIDIIWIKDGKVVDLYRDAQPCGLSCPTYFPKVTDNYILEVKSGFAERHNIGIGDSVKIKQ
jgi:uncharacterized membrane protein (UPF0127 family)